MKHVFAPMVWASKWKKPLHRTSSMQWLFIFQADSLNAFFLKPSEHVQGDDCENHSNDPVIDAQHFW